MRLVLIKAGLFLMKSFYIFEINSGVKKVLFYIFIILLQQRGFSQWHKLPVPITPPWAGTSMSFPLNICPLSDGKLVFSSFNFLSPSSGAIHKLYLSYNDLSSYTYTNKYLDQRCYNNIRQPFSINDSTVGFVGDCYGPFIWYTQNSFQNMSFKGFGNYFMTPPNTYPLLNAYCLSSNFIYALVTGVNFGDTLNFSRTAFTSTVNTYVKLYKYHKNPSGYSYKTEFLNDSTGFCIVADKNNQNKTVLIRTNSYGNLWSELYIDSVNAIKQFSFRSSNIGYLMKMNGDIYKTANGGSDWNQIESPVTGSISCIKFANDTLGYCSGSSGQLWKTINGGAAWTSEVHTCTNNISAIYTFSNGVAYFVDKGNNVYKTNVVGLNENSPFAGLTVFPNPSDNLITIEFNATNETIKIIRIINLLGEVVEEKSFSQYGNKIVISVQNMPAGIYFIIVDADGKVLKQKISVIH